MASTADVVWLDVLPSMKSFLPELTRAVGSAAQQGGARAGQEFGQAFGNRAANEVEDASKKMARALKEAETAAERVTAAERGLADAMGRTSVARTRLTELQQRGNASASQLANAQEALARATRAQESASEKAAQARSRETTAQSNLSEASQRLNRAQQDQTKAQRDSNDASEEGSQRNRQLAGDMDNTGKRTSLLAGAFNGLKTAVAVGFGAFYAAQGAINFLGGAISAASDLSETVNKSNVIFGQNAARIEEWANGSARSLGLSKAAALEAAAGFGDMYSQLGFTSEAAADMAMETVQLSADLGSFNNLPTADVAERISAAFRGEYDSLQLLIPNINAARVEQQAMAMTGKENAEALTAQEKAAAVLAIVQQDGARAMGDFARTSDGLANRQKILAAEWDNLKARLGELLIGPMTAIVGFITDKALPAFGNLIEQAPNLIASFKELDAQGVGEVFDNMFGNTGILVSPIRTITEMVIDEVIPAFRALDGVATDLVAALVQIALPLAAAFVELGLTLLPPVVAGLSALAEVIARFSGWLVPLVAAVGAFMVTLRAVAAVQTAYIVVMQAYAFATYAAAGATGVFSTAMALLKTAFLTNPVGMVIAGLVALGAALYVAWTQSETFRNVVKGALSAVGDAGVWMWENALRPAWEGMKAAWDAVTAAVAAGWTGYIQPAWNAVAAAAGWLFTTVLLPAFNGIKTAWDAIATGIGWAWTNIIQPAWNAISTAAQVLLAVLAVAVFGPILAAWNLLAAGVQLAWNGLIKPAWDALAAAATWLWNSVLSPTWGQIKAGWDILAAGFGLAWNNLIKPAFDGLAAAASWLWNSVLSPAFSGIKTAWDALAAGIGWAWTNIIQPTFNFLSTAAQVLLAVLVTAVFGPILAAWNLLSAGIQFAWTNIIQPVWEFIKVHAMTLLAVLAVAVFGPILVAWNLLSAGIQLAWNGILKPTWDAIQAAALWMWNNVLAPTWDQIRAGWDVLISLIVAAWNNILRPAWDAINAAALWMWNNVFRPTWDAIRAGWDLLIALMLAAWNNVLRPTWTAIETAALFMWNNVFRPTWDAVRAGWDLLISLIVAAWNNVLRPTWDAINAAVRFMWDNVARPIWDAMRAGWEGLANGLRWVWDNIIKPAFDAVAGGIGWLRDRFNEGVDWIRDIWNRLRGYTAKPINFLIDTVWNRGVLGVWNKVADLLPGVDRADPVPLIPEAAEGGQFTATGVDNYAAGGPVRGRWRGPRADNILGLVDNDHPVKINPREWIHPVAAVDKYGPEFMAAVQHGAFPEEVAHNWARHPALYADGGQIPGYATGDQIAAVIRAAFPSLRYTSGHRPGDSGMHGRNQAADLAPPSPSASGHPILGDAELWWAQNYGSTTDQLIYNGAGDKQANLYMGRAHAYNAATQAEHRNHLHIGYAGSLATPTGAVLAPPGTTGNALSPAEILGQLLNQVAEIFERPARAIVNAIPWNAPPQWLGLPKKVGTWAIDEAMKWFNERAQAKAVTMASASEMTTSPAVTGPVKDQVKQVAAQWGWDVGAHWESIDWIVQRESGWNPNAKNPSSTASGLFQMIDGTWRAYRPADASGYPTMRAAPVNMQATAGMNYFKGRYGNPVAARNFWQANGWYGTGGQIPAYFHNGGVVPANRGDVPAYLRPDERVLTPEQDSYFRRFVDVVEANYGPAAARPLLGSMEIHMAESDPRIVADEILHRMRVADRGGAFTSAAYGG